MSQDEQQRIWQALAAHGGELEAMRRSVERIETAIAGNIALKQPGMVDRQDLLEASQDKISERMKRLEAKVIFVTGFTACLVGVWEIIKTALK